MKVKVEKLSNNDNSFRTPLDQIDGMPKLPEAGERLLLTSSSFESGGISTSEVKSVEESEDGWVVKTEFSTYLIKEIKE